MILWVLGLFLILCVLILAGAPQKCEPRLHHVCGLFVGRAVGGGVVDVCHKAICDAVVGEKSIWLADAPNGNGMQKSAVAQRRRLGCSRGGLEMGDTGLLRTHTHTR